MPAWSGVELAAVASKEASPTGFGEGLGFFPREVAFPFQQPGQVPRCLPEREQFGGSLLLVATGQPGVVVAMLQPACESVLDRLKSTGRVVPGVVW